MSNFTIQIETIWAQRVVREWKENSSKVFLNNFENKLDYNDLQGCSFEIRASSTFSGDTETTIVLYSASGDYIGEQTFI